MPHNEIVINKSILQCFKNSQFALITPPLSIIQSRNQFCTCSYGLMVYQHRRKIKNEINNETLFNHIPQIPVVHCILQNLFETKYVKRISIAVIKEFGLHLSSYEIDNKYQRNRILQYVFRAR